MAPEGNLINNIGGTWGKQEGCEACVCGAPQDRRPFFFFRRKATLSAHNITEDIRNRAVALWKGKMKM